MKTIKKVFTAIFCIVILIFLMESCTKKSESDCGCEGEVIRTIPVTTNLTGQISYKRQLDPNDNFYNDTYWLSYPDSSICFPCSSSTSFIICNESILSTELKEIKNLSGGTSLKVQFSGNIKELCNKQFNPANNVFYHITLTKILKQ